MLASVSFLRVARRLRLDTRGNVAVIFGLSFVPLILTAGGAIDYAQAMQKKSFIQQAMDTGLLAAAIHKQPSSAYLAKAVNSNLKFGNVTVADATLSTATGADGGLVYNGDASFVVKTRFLKMVGLPDMTVAAHAEVKLPGQLVTAAFTPTNTQGAFSKDIFLWTKDASGAVTSRQTVLTYRYSAASASSVTTPPIGTQTVTFTVPAYSTYGLGMVAYQDSTNYSGDLINPVEMWTDAANASSFIHKTGACENAGGATYNWEDGGDANFMDFVYTMTCTKGIVPGAVARLSK